MTKLEVTKPKFGELTQIANDLYWAHFELPFRLNHVNLFLMDTDRFTYARSLTLSSFVLFNPRV